MEQMSLAPVFAVVFLAITIFALCMQQRALDDRIAELAKDNQQLRSLLIQETQNHTKCIEKNIELLRQLEEIKYPSK